VLNYRIERRSNGLIRVTGELTQPEVLEFQDLLNRYGADVKPHLKKFLPEIHSARIQVVEATVETRNTLAYAYPGYTYMLTLDCWQTPPMTSWDSDPYQYQYMPLMDPSLIQAFAPTNLVFDPVPMIEEPTTDTEMIEYNISEEDTNMGFGAATGKKGSKFPDSIKDLDFSTLHNSQMWVLADFVGARRQLGMLQGKTTEQRTALKQACDAQPQRAQFGYEIIVLQKDPPKGTDTIPKDQEAHYIELLCDILNKYSQGLEESSKTAVDKILLGIRDKLKQTEAELRDLAKQAVLEAAEKRAPIIIREGDVKRKVKGVMPPEFKTMVELASERIPILLVGPAGCGKTYLAAKLAEALGMEFSDQSCSEGMSESVFNGRLLPIGKNGEFKHVPTPFMQRYENGGTMLLDEIDAGDPNLFTYINKAIANTSYTVEQRHTNPVVKKHSDFVLIAAANTYGNGADAMYVGRNQLDAATLDRFRVGLLPLDYCREVEESLAPSSVCNWAWEIRDKINKQKLRRIMSTRVIEQMGRMHQRYKWDRAQWDKVYFTGWTEAERKLVA